MPRLHLTDKSVAALKSQPGQPTFWDSHLFGFGIRVGLHRKTWTVMAGKHRKRITLGHYPAIPLKDARTAARSILHRKYDNSSTFTETLDQFTQLHLIPNTKPSSAKALERLLRKHFEPSLGSRKLADITARDITALIMGLSDTPTEANSAFASIKLLYNWAASQHLIDHSPLIHSKPPFKKHSRDRTLSDDELVKILAWAHTSRSRFATMILLLIHTAQRRQQIGALRWSYIADDAISWPKEAMKGNRPHTIPLTESMKALLQALPRLHDHVFAVHRPFSSWSHDMVELRKECGITARFTIHDLRRTTSTNLNRLGVASNVVEQILAHAQPKLAGIYNRYKYQSEMLAAFKSHDAFLAKLRAHSPSVLQEQI